MWKIGNFRLDFDKILGKDLSESLIIIFFAAISCGIPKLTA